MAARGVEAAELCIGELWTKHAGKYATKLCKVQLVDVAETAPLRLPLEKRCENSQATWKQKKQCHNA